MKSIRPKTFQLDSDSNDLEVCSLFAPALGILLKTYRLITQRSSSLKTIVEPRELCAAEQKRKQKILFKFVPSGYVSSLALTFCTQPGSRVTLCLKNVPRDVAQGYNPNLPFVLFALLHHEHKYTTLNFAMQRNTEYAGPVKSKVGWLSFFFPFSYHYFSGSHDSLCR